MARTGIGYQEVELAAEKLTQQGVSPTIERIRIILGTGSNSTVSKYLTEWKIKQVKQRINAQAPAVLPTESLNQAVVHVWEKLQAESQAKLKALEEEAKNKIQLAQEEKEQALDELQYIKEDNQQLRILLKDLREQNEAYAKEQVQLNQTLAVLKTKCITIETSAKNFQQFANETLTLLETKYQQVVTQHEAQITQNKEFYSEELSQLKEIAEKQRHEHIIEIDHVKTMNQKLQTQLAEKDKVQLGLSNELGKLNNQLQKQESNVLELCTKIQKNEKQAEVVKADIIRHIGKTIQTALEKQKKDLFSVFEQQITKVKKPMKVKVHEPIT